MVEAAGIQRVEVVIRVGGVQGRADGIDAGVGDGADRQTGVGVGVISGAAYVPCTGTYGSKSVIGSPA